MTNRRSLRSGAVPLFLLVCLLLGGSTRAAWPNLLLQLVAIAILAWAALAPPRAQSGVSGRHLLWLALAMVLVVALQFIPLPPALWAALPGRGAVARGFDLLGQPRPWLPLSLAPYDTLSSALWLLPPLAVLAGILRLGAYREQWLAVVVGIAAFAGTILGTLQVTSGVLESPWYLYTITNNGQATGLFANSNHMGTLLIVAIPFMAALLGVKRRGSRKVQNSAGRIALLAGAMVMLVVGLSVNGSLAAIGLGIPIVAASLLVRAPLTERWARWSIAGVGMLAVAVVIGILASPLPNNLTEQGTDQNYYSRHTSFANSLHATADAFPFGTGSGSFPSVYPGYENPDIVDRWFVNHVHNDYIELVLETGLAGILLILAFLLWWTGRVIAIWRSPIIDHFARASTIASGAILAHSMVDFPLRTSAIAAVFAMCLALMAGPRRLLKIEHVDNIAPDGARHLSID